MLNLCINFHPYLIFYFLSHQLCYECFLGREQPNFLYFKCLQLCDTDIRQDELMLLHKYLSHALLFFLEMKSWLFFLSNTIYPITSFCSTARKIAFFFFFLLWMIHFQMLNFLKYLYDEKKKNKCWEGMDFFFQAPEYENENCFYVRSNSSHYSFHTYNLSMSL